MAHNTSCHFDNVNGLLGHNAFYGIRLRGTSWEVCDKADTSAYILDGTIGKNGNADKFAYADEARDYRLGFTSDGTGLQFLVKKVNIKMSNFNLQDYGG